MYQLIQTVERKNCNHGKLRSQLWWAIRNRYPQHRIERKGTKQTFISNRLWEIHLTSKDIFSYQMETTKGGKQCRNKREKTISIKALSNYFKYWAISATKKVGKQWRSTMGRRNQNLLLGIGELNRLTQPSKGKQKRAVRSKVNGKRVCTRTGHRGFSHQGWRPPRQTREQEGGQGQTHAQWHMQLREACTGRGEVTAGQSYLQGLRALARVNFHSHISRQYCFLRHFLQYIALYRYMRGEKTNVMWAGTAN